jgi:hypothetical protein
LGQVPGAGGVVHVYDLSSGALAHLATLTGSSSVYGDEFGVALERDTDLLVVGAPEDRARGLRAGAAYVFRLIGGQWVEEARLAPTQLESKDFFGRHVAIHGDRLLVSAGGDDDNGAQAGAAYAFEHVGGSWTQRQHLANPGIGPYFGFRLDMEGMRLAIGALFGESAGELKGRAFVYDRVGDEGALYTFHWPRGIEVYCHCVAALAPCGNADGGAGCRFQVAGAQLMASGSVGVTADDLVLTARGIPANAPALLVLGDGRTSVVYADGVRCVGPGPSGALFRFGVAVGDTLGTAAFGPGLVAASQSLPAVAHLSAGTTWNFQVVYRANGGTCGTGGNLTNALAVTLEP